MKSISRRIYRAILGISLASMIVMVVTVLVVNEDLEETMLQVEFQEERDVFMRHQTLTEPVVWETANLTAAHIPAGMPAPPALPAVFQGLRANFSGEIEREGETYLVRIQASPSGIFYIAKNITHFEQRETLFKMALAVIVLVILVWSLLLAVFSSRRIVIPLRRLSDQISGIVVGANMPRIPLAYNDSELHAIAITFNGFLDEMEAFVKREQTLIGMASHELRTPIAVISGALDIMERRGQLSENDLATLGRIRAASSEMAVNIGMLLQLARRAPSGDNIRAVPLALAIQEALKGLELNYRLQDRVTLDVNPSLSVAADPDMLRMLLRNLIQNALQHTTRRIAIRIHSGLIEIADEGEGLSDAQQSILSGQKRMDHEGSSLGGLGLYIVTLMCERMQWRLEVAQSSSAGTVIRLHTPPGAILDASAG